MADKKKTAPKTLIEGVKIKLSIMDRVMLPAFLLKKGSMADLEIAEDIKKKAEVGEAEKKDIKFQKNPAGITWNVKKDKTFTFSKAEARCLRRSYEIADAAGELLTDMLGLCRKIRDIKI